MPPVSEGPVGVPFEVSDRDRDLMIRTLYGEAGRQSPREQAAVAQSIVNRVLADGFPDTVGEVVLQRGQYEPWATRRKELLDLPSEGRAYREAAQTVDDVLAGRVPDPSGGATHFWAPVAQAALGRVPPSWGRTGGIQVGATRFHAPNGAIERGPAIPPIDLKNATWTSLADAGVTPRSSGKASASLPAETKGSAMPESADDDLLALYGIASPKAASSPNAATSTKSSPASPIVIDPTAPAPVKGDGKLTDDDLLNAYLGVGAGVGIRKSEAGRPGDRKPEKTEPLPLQTDAGTIDGNTGELVVAGKPFTDNAKTAGRWDGLTNWANGALLGAGAPIAAGVAAAKETLFGSGGSFADNYDQARGVMGGMRESYRAENPITALTTELAGSIPTTIGATALGGAALGATGNMLLDAAAGSRIAAPLTSMGRFASGAAGQGSGLPALAMRVGSRGTAGAAAGAFGSAINSELTGGSVGENALRGAMFGGSVGGALPVVGAASRGTVNKLTGATSPELAQLARTARDLGVPVRAAEISDSRLLRGTDAALSKVPGMGYGGIDAAKQTALNLNVASLMGEDANRITPALMQSAKNRLGQTFDRIEKATWVRNDNEFSGDLGRIFGDASEALPPGQLGQLQNLVRRGILSKFDSATGEMEGSAYQALTRKGAPLSLMQDSSDTSLAHFAGRIRTALDGAFERSATGDLAYELRQARAQYRVMKVIEPLVTDTGGNINPAAFRGAVAKATSGMAYGQGGPLADLARVAQAFVPREASAAQMAQAEAAQAARAADRLRTAGGAAGVAVGAHHFAPYLAPYVSEAALPGLAAGAAGAVGGRIASSFLRSPMLANRLIDHALGTGRAGPVNRLMALMGETAYAPAASSYNRLRQAGNDNGEANRLAEFLAMREAPRRSAVR